MSVSGNILESLNEAKNVKSRYGINSTTTFISKVLGSLKVYFPNGSFDYNVRNITNIGLVVYLRYFSIPKAELTIENSKKARTFITFIVEGFNVKGRIKKMPTYTVNTSALGNLPSKVSRYSRIQTDDIDTVVDSITSYMIKNSDEFSRVSDVSTKVGKVQF